MENNNNPIQDIALTLIIKSNVSYPVPINILGNIFNPLDTSNATTEYQYNLTSFSITNENKINIQYKPLGASTFTNFSTSFFGNTFQDVVNALNTLGIGFFSYYTQGANKYITTYNDNYVFGLLNIYNDATITAPPSAFFTAEMSGTTGSVQGWVNATPTTFTPPPFSVGLALVVTSTDTIRISGVASNANSKKAAYITNLTLGTSPYYVNLNIGDSFDSGNILVGNYSWELGYIDY